MFEIIWKERALSLLNKLDSLIAKRIINKIDQLRDNPFSKNVKRLKGENAFRLRIGDYRVLFDLDINNKIIYILNISHRRKIYKRSFT